MRLFNHTKIENKALLAVLHRAAKAVGFVRTGKVVIRATPSIDDHIKGAVIDAPSGFYGGFLRPKKAEYNHNQHDLREDMEPIVSDGGFMFLAIPVNGDRDPLDLAEEIYRVAAHEWRHIRDKQMGRRFGNYRRRWEDRPHEKRAMRSEQKALKLKERKPEIQEAIIKLGIAIERIRDNKNP